MNQIFFYRETNHTFPGEKKHIVIYLLKGTVSGMKATVRFVTVMNDLFVCVKVLRPIQQRRSCRAGQLAFNTIPGQAYT